MRVDVMNMDAKKSGSIELDEGVFGVPIRKDILQRMVTWQLAKRRSGSHKTKGRSEIKGTTAKMMRQKGSGGARHGTRKVPQFRGGGTAFGPVVRDHGFALPKKIRKLALKTALSAKQASGELIVVDGIAVDGPQTKAFAAKLNTLGWSSVLIIDGSEVDPNVAKAARNIAQVDILPSQGANVYDILRRDTLVLTTAAISDLEARLK